jgi:DnaJ-class molecular chaperone
VKVLAGEGMPKGDGTKGDLRINFDIEFPELLQACKMQHGKQYATCHTTCTTISIASDFEFPGSAKVRRCG